MLPLTAAVSDDGHLTIAGCDTVALAREFGTPLYVFDEETLRHQCREFQAQFRTRHPDTAVSYAGKAYLGRALAALLAEEGMNLEVVSGGELAIARSVDFPPERISFHGNNKSEGELREALRCGIGRVAVDNFHERPRPAWRRRPAGVSPPAPLAGHRPHTHHHTTTGVLDSKFGSPFSLRRLATKVRGYHQAEAAVQALDMLDLEPSVCTCIWARPSSSSRPALRPLT
jgi:diaminopimelate decarboxylase